MAGISSLITPLPVLAQRRRSRPNIVIIYADDLGFGDLSCYGATSIETPNIDRLAARGVRFTNAHSPSPTCTPSRYAMLTGNYAWRTAQGQILPGDAAALIKPGQFTLPSMLKRAGYVTGLVGKWHLGLGDGIIDWNGEIAPGPLEVGFDYAHFIPATIDRVPTVLVEGRRIANLDPQDPIVVNYERPIAAEPNGRDNPEQLRLRADRQHSGTIVNGVSRIGYMTGGRSARWIDEHLTDDLVKKATAFISMPKAQPYFLYLALNEPHVPRLPNPRFVGKSGMGPRGDAILQLDAAVGSVLEKINDLGQRDNTWVIFSSDNGPVLIDGYEDDAVNRLGNHRPSGPFRSGKYSIYEGGTRVPMISSWPANGLSGVQSSALVDHVDLLGSFAALLDQDLPADAAIDSVNTLSSFLGFDRKGRKWLVKDTVVLRSNGDRETRGILLGLVTRRWKFIRGGSQHRILHGNDTGGSTMPQLYDLIADPGERNNIAPLKPGVVDRLQSILTKAEENGSRQTS